MAASTEAEETPNGHSDSYILSHMTAAIRISRGFRLATIGCDSKERVDFSEWIAADLLKSLRDLDIL